MSGFAVLYPTYKADGYAGFLDRIITSQKENNRLIVEPVRKAGLLSVLSGLKPIKDEFPDIDKNLKPLDGIDL